MNTSGRCVKTATFLSVVAPGVGHVYCGDIVRGLSLYCATLMLGPMGLFGLVPISWWFRSFAVIATVLSTVLWCYAIYDSRRLALAQAKDYELKDYNRWYVYVMLVLIGIPVIMGWGVYVREGVVQAFYVPSVSMSPTIEKNEYIFLNKLAYNRYPVRRGDIVVFKNPNQRHQMYVKRVVALPGDTVVVNGNKLSINGRPLEYVAAKGDTAFEQNNGVSYQVNVGSATKSKSTSLKIPNGHCFVLGDNRSSAKDSRFFGPVPLRDLQGRVEQIYYPRWQNILPKKVKG